VYLPERLSSAGDYAAAIRKNALADLRISPGRCDFSGTEEIRLPLEMRGAEDQRINADFFLDALKDSGR
jgi:hypothetical protein